MKKIVLVLSVVLLALMLTGCDLFATKIVEYVEVVDKNDNPANGFTLATLTLLNVELKSNFGVEILTTNKVKVPTENQEKTNIELDASITLLKTAGALAVEEIEYVESTKTLLITASVANVE